MIFKPYDISAEKKIGRVEISAHLKGSYVALKKTMSELLAAHAGLALEAISVHRERTAETAMDIDLRLTFFYRKHPDAAAP